jgi:hypothetical protein
VPSDAVLVVRCPYCISGIGFTPMIAYKDGRFECPNCAHTVRPNDADFQCTCRKCLEVSRHGPCVSS